MQQGIVPQLGKEQDVQALGRTWRLGRLTVDVWDDLLEWAKPRLPDPFAGLEKILDKVPEHVANRLINEAQEKRDIILSVNSPQIQEVLATVEGRVYQFYLLLKEHQPDVTRQQAFEVLKELGERKAQEAVAKANGVLPDRGNAPAPAASA